MKFAVVISDYYKEISDGLLWGAKKAFEQARVPFSDIEFVPAPGAFEIPLVAQRLVDKELYKGIVCLGCVIKGQTHHFEAIVQGLAYGLMEVSLNSRIPVSFGVLTVYDEDQATARSRQDDYNKGYEATSACLKVAGV